MLFKRLELHGFKTFANRTEFEFGTGITAIVGPNGCGKSNVADAVRWVLGEQSGRLLRTKKAEDVIFAGSSLRPPAGMSQVTLTLDNGSGWLPLDFAEVTLGRRVYRSGESEYYINRGRVRLRDVVDLLLKANVGENSYTVIGQGLVDSALSLRPEERRGLIEEAADLKRHYAKIGEARNKLEATLQNLARARDILAEIGPRLSRLQKQASQAAEYGRLTKELSSLLTIWCYQSWQKVTASLMVERQAAAECRADLHRRQEGLDSLIASIDEIRTLRNLRRGDVGSWQKERAATAGRLDRTSQQLAVDSERLASYAHQRGALIEEIDALNASILAETESLAATRGRLSRLERDSSVEKAEVGSIQAELEGQNAKQAELQTRASKRQEQSLAAAAALADLRNRLQQQEERDRKLVAEVSRLEGERERLREAISKELGRLTELRERSEASARELSALGAEREQHLLAGQEARARVKQLEEKRGETQREVARLQSQLETLARLQDSHTGLYAGVRTVLEASGGSRGKGHSTLSGLVGIVASLIEVPPHLEVAVEVALGGHLQDIVVEKWAHAEEAIELLKRTRGGRATFLPLDSVRGENPSAGRIAPPGIAGVIGSASELVGYDSRLALVMRQLLGQIIVVEDLAVARKVMQGPIAGGQIVTLAGEIVRPNGSLTGGATKTQAEGAMLFRVRGLRELPQQIRQVDARQREIERSLETERDGERSLGAKLAELESRERQLRQASHHLEAELSRTQRQLDRLQQEAEFQARLSRQAEDERTEAEGRRRELRAKLAEAESAADRARRHLDDQQQTNADALAAHAKALERFNGLRTKVAVAEQAMESERSLVANHHLALRRQEAQRETKQERVAVLLAETSQLESEVAFLESEKSDLARQVEALDACIELALARLAELDAEETALLAAESALKAKVLESERQLVRANMAVQRCDEDLADLREKMEAEGIELPVEALPLAGNPDPGIHPWQLSLNLRGTAAATAEAPSAISLKLLVEEATGGNGDHGPLSPTPRPEGTRQPLSPDAAVLKRRIDRLRGQLRSIGPVNTAVIDEYEETKSRHDFLEAQIRDLAESERSLREGIALLEAEAKKRFDEAFETLGREFKGFFSQLFGGGTAKLVRSDGGDGGGVDIVAQPPGKRLQSLSLLSGGERALTATALLFAILKVNPAPFCILDEVDAALDETNIGRFVDALRQLAASTQFIVITHNRGTVEMADTLYGISLGSDGVSKMVSLRLSEPQMARI